MACGRRASARAGARAGAQARPASARGAGAAPRVGLLVTGGRGIDTPAAQKVEWVLRKGLCYQRVRGHNMGRHS